MIFPASDYISRQELEKDIARLIGLDITTNKDAGHSIEGKREDLRKLFLDDTCTVYGIKVKILDDPTLPTKLKKPKNG